MTEFKNANTLAHEVNDIMTCNGEHLCPICNQIKPCPFLGCGRPKISKCDNCLLIEEYGPKSAQIIQKAFKVAAHLDDIMKQCYEVPNRGKWETLWPSREEANAWMTGATNALEGLDEAVGILHLRVKWANES